MTLADDSNLTATPLKAILKDRLILMGSLFLFTGLSWAYLFYDARQMDLSGSCCATLAGTQLSAWTFVDVGMLFVMWTIMMIGMMLPSVTPTVLMFAAVNRARRERSQPYVPTAAFVGGYLAAWTAFSLGITLIQWALHAGAILSPRMVSASPIFAGVLLVAAGIFQMTSLKRACLRHCRSPMDFILTQWKEGTTGALGMGWRQGVFCVACCWLVMALLFVAGVMNLVWVGVLTIFVLLERLMPRGVAWARVGGIAMILWGGWVLARTF